MAMDGVLNALSKCQILASDNTSLTCHFNPKQVSLSTGASWQTQPTKGSKETPPAAFQGTTPRSVSMELLFDASWQKLGSASSTARRSGQARGVEESIETLLNWTKPSTNSQPPPPADQAASPPTLRIVWGTHKGLSAFVCVLKTVSITYTEFEPDGPPTRATAKVDFEEVPGELPKKTNPTSGSPQGQRTHLMTAGDSLHSVAQREYGKPALWRGLAIVNGIDDPLRVFSGTTILIPPREDAEHLA